MLGPHPAGRAPGTGTAGATAVLPRNTNIPRSNHSRQGSSRGWDTAATSSSRKEGMVGPLSTAAAQTPATEEHIITEISNSSNRDAGEETEIETGMAEAIGIGTEIGKEIGTGESAGAIPGRGGSCDVYRCAHRWRPLSFFDWIEWMFVCVIIVPVCREICAGRRFRFATVTERLCCMALPSSTTPTPACRCRVAVGGIDCLAVCIFIVCASIRCPRPVS